MYILYEYGMKVIQAPILIIAYCQPVWCGDCQISSSRHSVSASDYLQVLIKCHHLNVAEVRSSFARKIDLFLWTFGKDIFISKYSHIFAVGYSAWVRLSMGMMYSCVIEDQGHCNIGHKPIIQEQDNLWSRVPIFYKYWNNCGKNAIFVTKSKFLNKLNKGNLH